MMKRVKENWQLLKETVKGFDEDQGMKLSASLSYYTIFSIAPVIVIVISVAGLVFGKDAVAGRIYYQIKSLIGPDAALQIQSIIANVQLQDQGFAGTVIGVTILLFGATGVFTEIQSSINFIWSIKAKPKRGILKYIINRLLSFSLIMSIGFILMVSLLVNSVADVLYDKLQHLFNTTSLNLLYGFNILLIFVIITALFTVIFKVLPDAYIRWKDAMLGSSFTAVLFIIGKFIIGLYIGNSKLGVTYGAAASIIVILVWVYYTSIILYLGAEFTKTYAKRKGGGIKPNAQAVYIIKTESIEMPAMNVAKTDTQ